MDEHCRKLEKRLFEERANEPKQIISRTAETAAAQVLAAVPHTPPGRAPDASWGAPIGKRQFC